MKDKRTFDWGPPPQKGDSLKEVLVYFFIGVIFFGGIYMLLDVGKKPSYIAVEDEALETSTPQKSTIVYSKDMNKYEPVNMKKQPAEIPELPSVEIAYESKNNIVAETQNKPVYYVQMGSFTDEASAAEIFKMLKDIGSEPILKNPDEKSEFYRVLIGPFNSEADADYKAEKLNELDL